MLRSILVERCNVAAQKTYAFCNGCTLLADQDLLKGKLGHSPIPATSYAFVHNMPDLLSLNVNPRDLHQQCSRASSLTQATDAEGRCLTNGEQPSLVLWIRRLCHHPSTNACHLLILPIGNGHGSHEAAIFLTLPEIPLGSLR